jgi:hypothetical protein
MPDLMPEAVASLFATDRPQRRRPGPAPFTPTPQQRDLVCILTGFGISQPQIAALLARNGVPCTTERSLRRVFRNELKAGREAMIATLGMRMFQLATHDGPHSFQACAFFVAHLGRAAMAGEGSRGRRRPGARRGKQRANYIAA